MNEAEKAGLVYCAHCGWPPNNHFDFGEKVCAHWPLSGFKQVKCPGFKAAFKLGSRIRAKKN